MNTRHLQCMSSSFSLRACLLKTSIVVHLHHQTSSSNGFHKIKVLYNEGKEVDAIQEYFKNPSSFAASFLIARQKRIDIAWKIYQAAKNNSSLDFPVIRTLITALGRSNENQVLIDTVFDDSMAEIYKMRSKDIVKIKSTDWVSILRGLFKKRREKDVLEVRNILQKHIEENVNMDITLKNCLIHMYGKYKYLKEALAIFNRTKMSETNVITWTTMISAYGEHGKGKEALELYIQMQKEGVKPDNQTVTCVLKACCESNLMDNAAEVLFSMEKNLGLKPDEYHYNCLFAACADKGLILLGEKIHNYIIENNVPKNII
jgi:pentatricopeptide repeat protein